MLARSERVSGERRSFPAASSFAVTADHPALAQALVHELRERGARAASASSLPPTVPCVILTSGVAAGDPFEHHWQTLDLARTFRDAGCQRLVLLQDTGGDFDVGPSGGWAGGITGLARTAALEWPDMAVGLIDIDLHIGDMSRAASHIADAVSDDRPEVGVNDDGSKTTLELGPPLSPPTASDHPSDSAGVWLVSGGARGVTAACVIELARRVGGRYALLGRSTTKTWPDDLPRTDDADTLRAVLVEHAAAQEQPPKAADIERRVRSLLASLEVERTLSAIRAAGADVRYEMVDLSDQGRVQDCVARIQDRFGPITGLIHGAGVLADRLIVDMTREEFDRVFSAKVGGLKILLDVLDLPLLRHVALFSSASAYFGNGGQANYAMANAFIDGLA
ncbi:MAG: SDR family NAD(P)-dependent oxidoreductase, partial [Geminicoccaceae bacterium]